MALAMVFMVVPAFADLEFKFDFDNDQVWDYTWNLDPPCGAILSEPPIFEWTAGPYDAFLFYSRFNYAGLGYYPYYFWLNVTSFQMPDNWWNMLATDAPHIWAVLGYNTSTSEYEWSNFCWFWKVP